MHIKFIPKKRCYTHTQARLRTDAFLHRKIFTHRRLVYTQKVSQREPPTHKCPYTYGRNFCADFFFTKKPIHNAALARKQIYTEQPLHASKLQFQRDFSSLTIISCEKFVKISHRSGKNDGEKQRFSHSCDSPTGNGKRATAKGNGTTTVQRERDKGTTAWASTDSLGNEGQQIRPNRPKDQGKEQHWEHAPPAGQ